MRDVVIVSAVRTAVGKFQGALSEMPTTKLGSLVVEEAVSRAGIPPETVDECIMECAPSAGPRQSPAQQVALQSSLADTISAFT